MNEDLCSYCGVHQAEEKDHVPPKSIFVRPLPNDMIRVPVCKGCHRNFSVLDEEFRVFLSLRVGVDTDTTMRFWEESAKRTVRHNRRLGREVLSKLRVQEFATPAGVYLGEASTVSFSARKHNEFIERMVRGLYWHHFHEVLGYSVIVSVYVRNLWESAEPMVEAIRVLGPHMVGSSIGDKQFRYRYGRADDEPLASFWTFAFHDRYPVFALTEPVELRASSGES